MAITATDWGRRVEITGLSPSASLSGFTAVITLDNVPTEMVDAGSNSALNGGGDIRVCENSDGTNQLPLEVVTFVTSATPANRKCILWVRFPTYASGTRSCWLFYKKAGESQPAVTGTYGRNNVWQDRSLAFHMESTSPTDVTGGGDDGTSNTGVTVVSGKVGDALNYNGTAANVQTNFGIAQQVNSANPFTISFWLNQPVSGSPQFGGVFYVANDTGDAFRAFYSNAGSYADLSIGGRSGTNQFTKFRVTGLTLGAFNYVEIVFDGVDHEATSSYTVYIDGVSQTLLSTGSFNAAGTNNVLGTQANTGLQNVCAIDEFHIEDNHARTASESASYYANQNNPSTFWTTGTPEDTTGGGPSTQNITPTLIASATTVYSPTVALTLQEVLPSRVESTAVVNSPTVEVGAITISPDRIESTTVLYTPEVQNLLQAVECDIVPSGLVVFSPLVLGGDSIVIPVPDRITWSKVANHLRGLSFTGTTNDVIMKWLLSEGYVDPDWNDRMRAYFKAEGYLGSFDDQWNKWSKGE